MNGYLCRGAQVKGFFFVSAHWLSIESLYFSPTCQGAFSHWSQSLTQVPCWIEDDWTCRLSVHLFLFSVTRDNLLLSTHQDPRQNHMKDFLFKVFHLFIDPLPLPATTRTVSLARLCWTPTRSPSLKCVYSIFIPVGSLNCHLSFTQSDCLGIPKHQPNQFSIPFVFLIPFTFPAAEIMHYSFLIGPLWKWLPKPYRTVANQWHCSHWIPFLLYQVPLQLVFPTWSAKSQGVKGTSGTEITIDY